MSRATYCCARGKFEGLERLRTDCCRIAGRDIEGPCGHLSRGPPTLVGGTTEGHGVAFHLADLTTFVGIGGVFIAVFARKLLSKPVVPVGDPRLTESLAFENF